MKRLIKYIIPLSAFFILLYPQTFFSIADAELSIRLICPENQTCQDPKVSEGIIELSDSYQKDDLISLEIVLTNPGQKSVASVQSWLSYEPSNLEGISIETSESFDLVAPGEKNFFEDTSQIKIGLASTQGGVSLSEFVVATLNFKVIASDNTTSTLSFFDYQLSELGKTNVIIFEDNFPVNILEKEPSSFVIPLNKGAQVGGPPSPVTNDPVIEKPMTLDRPEDVKISTGNQYAYLKWMPTRDIRVEGYNIYYATQSGEYVHKKNVGGVNSFYLSGLQNNIRYYLAITSYDSQGNESDYSDEVSIIINHPETSSDPISLIQTDIGKTETGPGSLVAILLALIAGIIGYVLSSPKKVKIHISSK